mmetsp:Transcript_22916/g.53633  ORF Transcript_22916/g.53633 Transcript_22916/m.53633 type:complete len:369 (-) Transcript_22916:307-1413(-)
MPSAKRANATQGATASKKAKVNPMLAGVEDVIKASSLTPEVKTMLLAMMPFSLGVSAADRDENQQQVVTMVGSVVEEEKAKLSAAVSELEEKLAAVGSSKETFEEKAKSIEDGVKKATEAATAREAKVVEDTEQVDKAKDEHEKAVASQKGFEEAATQAKEKKAALESASDNHFRALREGDGSAAGPKTHLDALVPLLKTLGFEDSLVGALPAACMKEPAARGFFDNTVLDQLSTQITEKIAALATLAEEKETEATNMQAVVEEKNRNLQGATFSREESIERRDEAVENKQKMEVKLGEALKAVVDYEPNLKIAQDALKAKCDELEAFNTYNVGCYQLLANPPAPKQAVIEATTAEEAAPEVAQVGGA